MTKHFTQTVIFLASVVLFINCNPSDSSSQETAIKSIQTPNYDKEQKEFLEQVVFNDSILDSLLVWTNPFEFEFGRLYLKTPGLDTTLIPKIWQSSYTTVSDSELVQIHQQFTAHQYTKWTKENLYGHEVLTMTDWHHLVDKYNDKGKDQLNEEYRWTYFREKKAKGSIRISKPIFFAKGNKAFFSFDASWGNCKGKIETNIYFKKNGKWKVYKALSGSIIC